MLILAIISGLHYKAGMGNKLKNKARAQRVPILSILRPKTAERFKRKLIQEGGCLVFTGTRNKAGYGFVDVTYAFKRVRFPILVHRLAWALHHGADPDPELLVLHRCNNPPCCNPGHLYLGTHRDNHDDMKRAGRARSGLKGVKGPNHPAAHSMHRRRAVVQMMLHDVAAGRGLNYTQTAKQAGISAQTAQRWWVERNRFR